MDDLPATDYKPPVTGSVLPPTDPEPDTTVPERCATAEAGATITDPESGRASSDTTNSRPPSLLAHESAIEYESFSYSTLPNSAPPDVLARWRQARLHRGAHAFSISPHRGDGDWEGEPCCKQMLRRRITLFLVLLLTGVVMAVVTVATVWITESNRPKSVHSTNNTGSMYSS